MTTHHKRFVFSRSEKKPTIVTYTTPQKMDKKILSEFAVKCKQQKSCRKLLPKKKRSHSSMTCNFSTMQAAKAALFVPRKSTCVAVTHDPSRYNHATITFFFFSRQRKKNDAMPTSWFSKLKLPHSKTLT